MDPIALRKGFAIKIMVEPSDTKVDKELDEEGKAPILEEVDGKKPEDEDSEAVEKILMNGEDRMVGKKLEQGYEPEGLTQKIQSEIMKKKMSQKA